MSFLNQVSRDKNTCKQVCAKTYVSIWHRGDYEGVSDQSELQAGGGGQNRECEWGPMEKMGK